MTRQPASHSGALITRRRALQLGLGISFAASGLLPPVASHAAARDPRFLLVILRGGLDGLATVMPVADPEFAAVRAEFNEDLLKVGAALPLDGTFALNACLPALGRRYAAGEALLVHAVATPYRERSHFDGQDVLESGLPSANHPDEGWLNRALTLLPGGERLAGAERGVSIGPMAPLVMRGPAPILSWSPQQLPGAPDDTVARLLALYEARDPALASALRRGAAIAEEVKSFGPGVRPRAGSAQAMVLAMAESAAQFLAKPDGPRIGALSIDGWDTHADQRPGTGRLGLLLRTLDQLIEVIARGLAPFWSDTVVAFVTEFGRTVRINGTAGTDHGTATIALLVGGAVRGGRVLADWPGLGPKALFEGRDLAPTTDLRGVLKGVLADHVGLSPARLAETVFPASRSVPPLQGLVK